MSLRDQSLHSLATEMGSMETESHNSYNDSVCELERLVDLGWPS